MTEDTQTAPAAEAAPKVERPKLEERHGVKQPAAGTKTRRVWDVADEISRANGRPALRDEVMKRLVDGEGFSQGTVATQYGKWCTFYQVTKEQREAVREANKPSKPAEGAPDADGAAAEGAAAE